MLRRILALLCLAVASYAAFPRPLADVPITAPGGKTIRLSQYKGKVMVVLIVLTTCEHCVKSAQLLARLQKDYGKDFQAVAVAVDSKAPELAVTFRELHRLNYPVGYLTDDNSVMKLADFKREDRPLSPMYLFVDKKGTVRLQYIGSDDNFFKNEEKNVRGVVEAYLKE